MTQSIMLIIYRRNEENIRMDLLLLIYSKNKLFAAKRGTPIPRSPGISDINKCVSNTDIAQGNVNIEECIVMLLRFNLFSQHTDPVELAFYTEGTIPGQ